MVYKVLFLAYLITSNALAKNNCSTVRLDKQDGPFSVIPVYNQKKFVKDDPGICYAVTASQLIDADRFFQGDRTLTQLSSPLSISIEYYKEKKRNMFSGDNSKNRLSLGDVLEAIVKSQNKPLCNQRKLENTISLFAHNSSQVEKYLSENQRSLEHFIQETVKQIDFLKSSNLYLSSGDDSQAGEVPCFTDYFLTISKDQLKDIESINRALLQSINEDDLVEQLYNVLRSFCKESSFYVKTNTPIKFDGATDRESKDFEAIWDRLPSEPEKLDENMAKLDRIGNNIKKMRSKRFNDKLNEVFSSDKPFPVAASFSYSMISEEGSGRHVAVIVGREFNKESNKCEYIIRDSYGDCINSYKYKCQNGNVWVPKDILIKKAFDLTWIPR
jgi:hypothetical protein